jgi:hypothetical protein
MKRKKTENYLKNPTAIFSHKFCKADERPFYLSNIKKITGITIQLTCRYGAPAE